MIAFRVQLNRAQAVTAGLSGEHVVSVLVDCGARDRISVTGLGTSVDGSQAHVRWLSDSLTIGDEITIAVVDVSQSEMSHHIDESPATVVNEGSERERLAYLLKKYGASADR